MTTAPTSTSGTSFGVVDVLVVVLGLFVLGYGLLLVPLSVLGGFWIAAIGLSLVLAGLFATEWSGVRFGLSAADRRTLSLSFGVLALFLFGSYLAINYVGFTTETVSGTAALGR